MTRTNLRQRIDHGAVAFFLCFLCAGFVRADEAEIGKRLKNKGAKM